MANTITVYSENKDITRTDITLHAPEYSNWKSFHWQYDNNSSIESGIAQKRGRGRAWDGENTLYLDDEWGATDRASWMKIKDNWIMLFKLETENFNHFEFNSTDTASGIATQNRNFSGSLYQTFRDAGRLEDLIDGRQGGLGLSNAWVRVVLRGGDEVGMDVESTADDVPDFTIKIIGDDGQLYVWANTEPNDKCWITLEGYKTVSENLASESDKETTQPQYFEGSLVDDKAEIFGPENDLPAGYVYSPTYYTLDEAIEAKKGSPFVRLDWEGHGRSYDADGDRVGNQLIIQARDRTFSDDAYEELYIEIADGWQVEWRCKFVLDNGYFDSITGDQTRQDIDEEFRIVMEGEDTLDIMFQRARIKTFSLKLDGKEQFSRPLVNEESKAYVTFNYDADFRLEFVQASKMEKQEGSEVEPIYGCMSPESLNYNPSANVDDGSCIFECPTGSHWDDRTQSCVPLDEPVDIVHEHEGETHLHEEGNIPHEHEDFPPTPTTPTTPPAEDEDSTNWLGIALIGIVIAFGFFVILRRRKGDFVQEGGESSGE